MDMHDGKAPFCLPYRRMGKLCSGTIKINTGMILPDQKTRSRSKEDLADAKLEAHVPCTSC